MVPEELLRLRVTSSGPERAALGTRLPKTSLSLELPHVCQTPSRRYQLGSERWQDSVSPEHIILHRRALAI